MFLIYINDIVNEINSHIRLFADDTSLYIVVDQPDQAAAIINSDLERMQNWANDWLVDFNPNKTKSLLMTRKTNSISTINSK